MLFSWKRYFCWLWFAVYLSKENTHYIYLLLRCFSEQFDLIVRYCIANTALLVHFDAFWQYFCCFELFIRNFSIWLDLFAKRSAPPRVCLFEALTFTKLGLVVLIALALLGLKVFARGKRLLNLFATNCNTFSLYVFRLTL